MTGQLIADAFQTGETVVDGAVLAVGFLSVVAAGLFLSAVLLLVRFVTRYRRTCREQTAREQRVLEECTPPVQAKAIRDIEPGQNLALQDDCELIWDMDAREPGPERLLWATRREQQKEADDA